MRTHPARREQVVVNKMWAEIIITVFFDFFNDSDFQMQSHCM